MDLIFSSGLTEVQLLLAIVCTFLFTGYIEDFGVSGKSLHRHSNCRNDFLYLRKQLYLKKAKQERNS